ncbi:hypothetical protein [Komagataeibacter europaeus]|uniref:hypothetical protein n=1 Tax=Komagataeibacter europaeus TaxID=33995 RepID=UPI00142DAC33|nr:hypothetical protein [Komagataeibacter europaeus]
MTEVSGEAFFKKLQETSALLEKGDARKLLFFIHAIRNGLMTPPAGIACGHVA